MVIIACMGFLDAVSDSSVVSCGSGGYMSEDSGRKIGMSLSGQLGWWLLFVVGSLTGNWGSSVLAGHRSFSAVTATLAHGIVLLFFAIGMMALNGMLPK